MSPSRAPAACSPGRLTDLAGASAYVNGGVVAYSNDVKTRLAGVPADLIDRCGAVSEEVAIALADGARASLQTSVGVGVTGVAGPGGGTPEKPVGLVWLAASTADGRRLTRRLSLGGGRATSATDDDARPAPAPSRAHDRRSACRSPHRVTRSRPGGTDNPEREAEPAV